MRLSARELAEVVMRKLPLLLILFLGAGSFAPAAAHAVTQFVAVLDGAQEVPAVATAASGVALLTLSDDQSALSIELLILGLDLDTDVIGGHIHAASAGANGGVVFGFLSPDNDTNGDTMEDSSTGLITTVWDGVEGNGTTLADQLVALFAGDLYVNIHTPAYPGGEIRGQILATPEPGLALLLIGGLAGLIARRS